jgi:hypothetical protein
MSANSREWLEAAAADVGESIVAAMTAAGVEYVFFTSGSEIPRWLSGQIGEFVDDGCIVFDETFAPNQAGDCLRLTRPGSYFNNSAVIAVWLPRFMQDS